MDAHVFPWASQHIPEMLSIVGTLLENGHAYERGGNIYFDVPSFPDYGKLSRNTGADLLEGVRAEADPLKRDPRDFTLWKAAEPGRDVKWDSPWGEGFPGWHIECSAMASKYLGEFFDIHTGGVDNIFPHPRGRNRPERSRLRRVGTSATGFTPSTSSPTGPRWQSPPATCS